MLLARTQARAVRACNISGCAAHVVQVAVRGHGAADRARSTLLLRKRQCRTYNRMYYIGALVGMLSMLTHASIDFPLQIESIAITVAKSTLACTGFWNASRGTQDTCTHKYNAT